MCSAGGISVTHVSIVSKILTNAVVVSEISHASERAWPRAASFKARIKPRKPAAIEESRNLRSIWTFVIRFCVGRKVCELGSSRGGGK